jgi:hypothetical protein
MRSTGSRLSFRVILFAIAVVGVLPTLAFSGLLLYRYAQSERERAERGLVESARAIARLIDGQFNEAESVLLAMRDSTALQAGDLATFGSGCAVQPRRPAAILRWSNPMARR